MTSSFRAAFSDTSVNTSRLADRNAWADFFGVAPAELVAAIKAVGPDAEAVFMHLWQKWRGNEGRNASFA